MGNSIKGFMDASNEMEKEGDLSQQRNEESRLLQMIDDIPDIEGEAGQAALHAILA
jgi:hypothetical protein